MKHLLVFLLLPMSLLAQQNFDTVKIRPFRLANNLHMLTGAGGNIALLTGSEGNLIVDDQYAPMSEKIAKATDAISPGGIKYVINTHLHGDHSGGNENFKKLGATLMAHDNVRARMMKQTVNRQGAIVPPRDKDAWPVITFETKMNVHLNGEDIDLIFIDRGHTDGDILVHFRQANVMHTGDAFGRKRYPFIDITSGGSFPGFINTLDIIYALSNDNTRIIPGHGVLSTRADIKAYRDLLVDIRDQVVAALKKGTRVEELASLPIASKYDAELSGGFVRGKDFVVLVADQMKATVELKK